MKKDIPDIALRRLVARALDVMLFAAALWVLIGPIVWHPVFSPVLFLTVVPVDAVLTWQFGMTPGKLLFRIRVTSVGESMNFMTALKRSARVWFFGQAAGIGVLMPFTFGIAYNHYREKGVTCWDEASGTTVRTI